MENNIHGFILLPLIGFVLLAIQKRGNERAIANISVLTLLSQLAFFFVVSAFWFLDGMPIWEHADFTLYEHQDYLFRIDFFWDKVSFVYCGVGAFLVFLVSFYSKTYMHREEGFKRFFLNLMFFFIGYNIVVLAGNFETLFIGWEILGVSSFLLIAFYRNRYLPVKNAVKVFSIYRLGDLGILLAMWLSHHFWHENVTFNQLNHQDLVIAHWSHQSAVGIAISLLILLTAMAKSAQLPFSSWLPRAMEGPTPSSAIFYGSLAVHGGVFLLLRTAHFWEAQDIVKWLIGIVGLVTAVVATGISRVQGSIKSQIAYSSIAQIGLMFIEMALGWYDLVLIHFAGNALLRTYQLLVSPSVVSYLIKEQFYHFTPKEKSIEDSLPKRIENSLYLLSLKEFNLDSFMYRFLWNPAKKYGSKLSFIRNGWLWALTLMTLLGAYGLLQSGGQWQQYRHYYPYVFACMAILLVLKAFTERRLVFWSWGMIIMNHFMVSAAIMFNEKFTWDHVALYLGGIIVAGALGFYILFRLKKAGYPVNLDQFHGLSRSHRKTAFVFLLACLGLTGFPITTTFLGEDLIFSHIHQDQWLLALLTGVSFILDGLAVIRVYARVFLGPHAESIFEMGYRSS